MDSYKLKLERFNKELKVVFENNAESEIRVQVFDCGEWMTVTWTYANPLMRNYKVTFNKTMIEYNRYDEILPRITELLSRKDEVVFAGC